MRTAKRIESAPITTDTFDRLYYLLDQVYPGKVWRVVECCPVAVVKTIDNERDALATIANIEGANPRLLVSKPPQDAKKGMCVCHSGSICGEACLRGICHDGCPKVPPGSEPTPPEGR